MTALQILAAWAAISVPAGLLVARCIPHTSDDASDQRGDVVKVRGSDQFHNGGINP